MTKSYKLALTGLLALCSGLYAMESEDKDTPITQLKQIKQGKKDETIYSQNEKNQITHQALLEYCVISMNQTPDEIINTVNCFGLDPNEVTNNIFLDQYKTSILGHWIGHLYKKMEKRIYESVVDDNSRIRYKMFNCSASGAVWVGVSTCETKKIKPIEKDDKLILEKLFKYKANLYSLTKTPCEKQTNPHTTNYITPQKVLSLLTENDKLYQKIRMQAKKDIIFIKQLANGFMTPFKKTLAKKQETFVNTIEELSKANK